MIRRIVGLLVLTLVIASAAHAAPLEVRVEAPKGPARENVRAYLAAPPEVSSRRGARIYARRSLEPVRRALQAVGYYTPTIRTTVEALEDEGWRVVFRIDPGEPVRVRELNVRLEGEGSESARFGEVVQSLPLAEGEVLDHSRYETAKARLRNVALSRGYFDHGFATSRVAVNTAEHRAAITLVFDTGPRYELGAVSFPAELPFSEDLLQRLVPFPPGTPYDSGQIADLNRNLLDSGYFSEVQVRTERDRAEAGGAIPVAVEARAREPNTLGFGLGFSTDEGPRTRINWQRHWLNDAGHSANAEFRVSAVRQNLTGTYTIPLSDPIDDRLQFQGGLQREDIEDTESLRYTLAARRQQHFDSGWERVQSLRLLRERFTQGSQEDTSTLLLPGLSFARTRSRGGVDPYWGDRQSYSLELAHERMLSDLSLARLVVGMKWLRTYYDRHQLSLRADLGGIATDAFSDVPSSLRFFAGGDSSVRGFGFNSLGPEDADGDLLGGRYLATGSVEYGYRFAEDWRAAVFTDAGNAFDEELEQPIRIGSGFGLRWLSPVGPVRVDLAWGVSEPDPPFRLHISLGPPL